MDFKKKNLQLRYKESIKTKKENSNRSFFLFVLLVLILFLLIQNNFVKESLFPTISYSSYSDEESIDYDILQAFDLMDKQLKEKFHYYIQLSAKNKVKTIELKIETSIIAKSKNKRNYAIEIFQSISQIRNDNTLLSEQPIDVLILSNNKKEIYHKLIK